GFFWFPGLIAIKKKPVPARECQAVLQGGGFRPIFLMKDDRFCEEIGESDREFTWGCDSDRPLTFWGGGAT
ncbi:MAG: hypothetical protein RLZZ435_3874, partial [Cyanobacteriota bacterium]